MPQSSPAQDLGNGVSRETLLDGRLVAFTLTSLSRSAVDTWVDAMLSQMANWPQNQPICVLSDQSPVVNMTISPYMKSRLQALGKLTPIMPGRVAIVTGKGFFLKYAMMLIKAPRMGTGIERRFFSDRDQAIAWLSGVLTPVSE